MTNLLLITSWIPWPVKDGYALRVIELARHLPAEFRCHLVSLNGDAERVRVLEDQGVFASITLLPPLPDRRHWLRWLRTDDRNYHRGTYPEHFRHAMRTMQDLVERESIDTVVSVLLRCEEFGRGLEGVTRVIDEFDCLTIAMERELAAPTNLNPWQRFGRQWRLRLAREAEARLADTCDLVTSISPPDVERLRQLTGGRVPVELVPNGVASSLLHRPATDAASVRGVAFWGNHSFPVNQLAVDWFYREVWLPHLEPQQVRWSIVGPHAGSAIQALADRHEEIEVPGFVDDLFGHLDRYPVMVNPMVSGTGLKNKVLEAFAVGKAVVTTAMGVEAFPVVDGVHCVVADDPGVFAAAVLRLLDDDAERAALATRARELVAERYSWETVARRWGTILSQSGAVQSA